MTLNEKQLIDGCLKGDGGSQRELFRLYYGKLMNICMRFAKDKDEAKDLLQEGFMKIFDHIHQFAGNSALETWMKRIVINLCINHYRKELKQLERVSIDEMDIADTETETMGGEEGISPELVLELIAKMPVGYRTVLNLYAIEGYSHKEIAEMAGISEGTSKSQLNKARKHLKTLLAEYITKDHQKNYTFNG